MSGLNLTSDQIATKLDIEIRRVERHGVTGAAAYAQALAAAYWVAKDREAPAAPARVPLTDEIVERAAEAFIDAAVSNNSGRWLDVRAALLATGVFEEVPGE